MGSNDQLCIYVCISHLTIVSLIAHYPIENHASVEVLEFKSFNFLLTVIKVITYSS